MRVSKSEKWVRFVWFANANCESSYVPLAGSGVMQKVLVESLEANPSESFRVVIPLAANAQLQKT